MAFREDKNKQTYFFIVNVTSYVSNQTLLYAGAN